ncbi:MAG TPA: tol-pal system-associated acyl-CoA thioesterase [Methylophilus sp.]|uniref:tol-pal system-associated acyl-CoA thioesterase n=1 Tax=Methylophilus sp. TaxID=29541 RepID=UPI002C3F22A3|nr:tol-pal system-associated acyl-CoA thioesterase [Methylophilus sp.]HSH87546.1 tol-pal system-associated acyl-CoA thioesterase [Methylophilus sp.]
MADSKPFEFPVRVYYEDTDAGGVVYHSQYLNFMERARTEWLRSLGFAQAALRQHDQVLFVVHSMQIQFKKPARLDDELTIVSQVTEMRLGSFSCQQQIMRDELVLLEAQVKVACVDADSFKPTGIPPRIKIALESS